MKKFTAAITGVSHYVPEKRLTNADLEKIVDTSDEWIRTRTGIQERRILDDGLGASFMATRALEQLLEQKSLGPEEIDLIVVATVTPEDLKPMCLVLRDNNETTFDYLLLLCVVDYEDYLQVVYHLYSTTLKHTLVIKTNVSPEEPSLDSVTSVWKGADWYEREAHDLFGVLFSGHPSLSPLLLYEGFEGFPGRRSYEMPEYKEW